MLNTNPFTTQGPIGLADYLTDLSSLMGWGFALIKALRMDWRGLIDFQCAVHLEYKADHSQLRGH
jgi:hypothetical protein